MAGYNDGWDPHQAEYGQTQFGDIAIGGLLGMAALAAIGVVALFTTAEVVAVEGGFMTFESTVYEGTTWYVGEGGVNPALALIVENIEAGNLTIDAAIRINTLSLLDEGFLDAAAIIALDNFNAFNPTHPGNFWHLGGSGFGAGPDNPGGGLQITPGFPDFVGGGHGWHYVCTHVTYDDAAGHSHDETHCYYEN